jgi:diphthamide synthase (EF-2-diphthine--ammonia ligase)
VHENFFTMADLFRQLGLPSDAQAIDAFIRQHQGVCRQHTLVAAPLWNDSQRQFLKEAIAQDSDWAIVAEKLTSQLSQ